MSKVPVRTLIEATSYDPETGSFQWLQRPIWHFKNDAKWSALDNQSRWNNRYSGTSAFRQVQKGSGYLSGVVDGIRVLAHRAAWAHVFCEWPDGSIDHKNRKRQDNRIANLRLASRSEQARNTSSTKNSTSGYLGVSWRKDRSCWRAAIFVDGRQKHLGTFSQEHEAALAYDQAALSHFGRFASLNFPIETNLAR